MKAQFIRGGDSMNSLQIGRSKYKESFELIEKIVNSIFEKYPFDPKEKQEFIDREEEVAGITFMGTMKKISQKKIINSPCEYFVAIVDFAKSRKHYFMGSTPFPLSDKNAFSAFSLTSYLCVLASLRSNFFIPRFRRRAGY